MTRRPIHKALYNHVHSLAKPYSDGKYDEYAQLCGALLGPYLQYKKDDFHLGRWLVTVRLFSLTTLFHSNILFSATATVPPGIPTSGISQPRSRALTAKVFDRSPQAMASF